MNDSEKHCYAVKVLYETTLRYPGKEEALNPVPGADKMFEESILLIKAASFDEAYDRAEKIAKDGQVTYETIDGMTAEKVLVDAIDCYWMDELEDGTEIYSFIHPVSGGVTAEEYLHTRYPDETGDSEIHRAKMFPFRLKEFSAPR